jgi:hypothetical protein
MHLSGALITIMFFRVFQLVYAQTVFSTTQKPILICDQAGHASSIIVQYHSLCRQWAPRICNGFRFEKDLEVDANYRRFLDWNILCRCSSVAKVWLCEYG